ncbi:MAG: cytochrome P450 [Chloroflexi bacterium]|nr:cytochrome P450 [Chloroflexota bacterium]MYF81913.1 cytochrome P450 [Chloroflexota bacterium]MYI05327.1 cytochrome P450 [Chloroflexota bacterium]
MALSDFNPIDPETLECPYPYYAALHAEAPVYPEPELGVTIVSGYDLLQEVVHDPETYSSAMAVGGAALPGRARAEPDEELAQLRRTFGRASIPTLLAADPPYHRRYRSLVEKALAPRRVMGMEGYVREIVTDLIDGFIDDGKVNFTRQFADELPMAVIADQIGVPRSDLKEFKRRADFAIGGLERRIPPDEERAILKAGIELQEFFLERAEERRRNPQDDILTTLATAELETDDGSRPLHDAEILSILQQLQVAGKETTAHLIGSAMLLFIENPDQLAAVQADPSLIGNMAEEALRVESPVRALFRTTTRPVTLGGVELEAGARLMLLYSAANRDECAFANAAQFDVSRENAPRHVAFSAGPHYCIGAALARLEIRVAFEEVLARMTNFRLDPAHPAPSHVPSFILRGLNDLHILFDRA